MVPVCEMVQTIYDTNVSGKDHDLARLQCLHKQATVLLSVFMSILHPYKVSEKNCLTFDEMLKHVDKVKDSVVK